MGDLDTFFAKKDKKKKGSKVCLLLKIMLVCIIGSPDIQINSDPLHLTLKSLRIVLKCSLNRDVSFQGYSKANTDIIAKNLEVNYITYLGFHILYSDAYLINNRIKNVSIFQLQQFLLCLNFVFYQKFGFNSGIREKRNRQARETGIQW